MRKKAVSTWQLKVKEDERAKAGEFNDNKGWFDNFRKRLFFKNVKITGEEASASQEASDKFPDITKEITEEKGNLSEWVLNADESAQFWKEKKRHKVHLLVKKRSKYQEYQDLRQEGTG